MAATVTAIATNTAPDTDPPFDQSVSVAVASGDTRVILVVQQADATLKSIDSGPTFDGAAMTEITGSPFSGGGTWEIRGYYIDVSAKSPGTYAAVLSFSAHPDDGVICAYALAGAGDPINWTEDTGTASTTIDIAVSSAADGLVIWAVAQDVDATLTPSGGETEVYDGLASGGVWYYASGYYKSASGTTTTSNIAMDSGDWGGVGFFVPSAGGGGTKELGGNAVATATAAAQLAIEKALGASAAGAGLATADPLLLKFLLAAASGQAVASGDLGLAKLLSGAATAGASATGQLQGGGTITTPPLKNNTGTVLASESDVTVHVYTAAGAHVVTKTGQTTNGAGVMAINDALLVAATSYRVIIALASGAEGMETLTAA